MITPDGAAWLLRLASWFEAASKCDPKTSIHLDAAACLESSKALRAIAEGAGIADDLEQWYEEVGCRGSGA